MNMKRGKACRLVPVLCALVAMVFFAAPALAQEPDPTVCDGFDCDNLPTDICDAGGFSVEFLEFDFVPANDPMNFTGTAIYTYEVCSPPAGVCTGDAGRSCLSHEDCAKHGAGECTRECATDQFRGLSHFNVDFPTLGDSCLGEDAMVTGTCECSAGSSMGCSVDGTVVIGDGSCYGANSSVAKCDNTTMNPGDCITMVLNIPGEEALPGLGAAVVISKESGDCNETCLAGPSCQPCDEPPGGGDGECFTRTLGFWGTHPWHTNDYAPVEVCGNPVGCSGADDGTSSPSCPAGTCDSIMEALGSNGGELKHTSAYISMIRQLAAAKINLNATGTLVPGATCSDWVFQDKSIHQWIATCEGLCNKSQSQISESGCIEALDNFNNSQDTGFDVTPEPFDRPPVDDHGNVSGADPSGFTAAKNSGVVIGKNVPQGENCN